MMAGAYRVSAIHPQTGKRHEWRSQREAARDLGWTGSGIGKAIDVAEGCPVALGKRLFGGKRKISLGKRRCPATAWPAKPVAGYPSLTAVAAAAGVSLATVSRAHKQGALRDILYRAEMRTEQ